MNEHPVLRYPSPRNDRDPSVRAELLEYRRSLSFAHFEGFSTAAVNVTGAGDPLRVDASWTTPEFFEVLGVNAWLGRVFTADVFEAGRRHVAVLSYRIWQSRSSSSPDIVGKTVLLNGRSCTVVGVMPRDFAFPARDVDVWQPLPIAAASANLGNHYLRLIGELKPQVTLQQAGTEVAAIFARIERQYPAYYGGATRLAWPELASYCLLRAPMSQVCCWPEERTADRRLQLALGASRGVL